MPQERTRKIVITGIMSAIAIFLGVTPFGFIPWLGFSLTIVQIPVIIGAILEGPVVGLIIGFIFGLTSLVKAATAPNTPGDVIFTYPLISILPRLFIGPIAWLVWTSLKRWAPLGLVVSGIAGSLTNTLLVLGAIGLYATTGFPEIVKVVGPSPWALIGGIIASSGLLEAGIAAVLVLIIGSAWMQIDVRRRKGANLDS
jgi:uncharacterized membrane protein